MCEKWTFLKKMFDRRKKRQEKIDRINELLARTMESQQKLDDEAEKTITTMQYHKKAHYGGN